MIRVIRVKLFILFTILLCIGNGKIRHQQSSREEQDLGYFQKLSTSESDLKAKLVELRNKIQYINTNLKQTEALPSIQIIALEEGLADERSFVYDLQQQISIPFAFKTVKCTNLTQTQKVSLAANIKSVEEDLRDLKSTLDKLSGKQTCLVCIELQKQYDWDYLYLTELKSALIDCPKLLQKATQPVDANGFMKISNLKANNWVFGDTTETEYYLNQFSIVTHKDVTKCELDAPFVLINTKTCSKCPQNQYFQISSQTCITCGQGLVFSLKEHQCVKPLPDGTLPIDTKCEGGKSYDFATKSCICPPSFPYFNGQICIKCVSPEYFDENTKKCSKCSEGTAFDISSKLCKVCPKEKPLIVDGVCTKCAGEAYYDFSLKKCVDCPKSKIYDQSNGMCKCPTLTPYYDNKACINCENPKYFSQSTLKCQECGNSSVFNPQTRSCVECPQVAPLADGFNCVACKENSIYDKATKKCMSCPVGLKYIPQTQKCQCPDQLPFYNGKDCQACRLPKVWDKDKKQCSLCSPGKFFDVNLEKCITCPTNMPLSKQGICQSCPQKTHYDSATNTCLDGQAVIPITCNSNYIFDYTKKQCVCNTTLFDSGTKCEECYLPRFWNVELKICQSCPQGLTYLKSLKKCSVCSPDTPFIKDYNCQACPDKNQYISAINVCKPCESDKVFNPSSKKCQYCPDKTPIIENGNCKECPDGTEYSTRSKKCEQCPTYNIFNLTTRKCEFCAQDTPLIENGKCKACDDGFVYNKNSMKCIEKVITCNPTYVYDKTIKKCTCQKDTPFDDGTKCVSCYLPQYWDNRLRQCLSCPPNAVYDTQIKKCVRCPHTNPISINGKCTPCPQNTVFNPQQNKCKGLETLCSATYVYDSTIKMCVCSSQTPFDNGIKCVACVSPKYWNSKTFECLSCPANQTYNVELKKCA